MVIGGLLKGSAGLQDSGVVSGAGYELQAYRKIFVGETARDRQRRETAQIADGAERIRE